MPKRVRIFDTTLRDGEQSPRASLNPKEKLEIAKQLDHLGVDIIEAGFPVSSPSEIKSIQAICAAVTRPTVCGLARVVRKDIDAAAEALKDARHSRIHVFIGTSPVHVERKLQKTRAEVIEMAAEGVRYAKERCHEVEFSAEDATRTPREYLKEVFTAAIEAGATVLNVPDTVGYGWPEEFGDLIRWLVSELPNMDKVAISVHCHNDLGMATANSLAAVKAGATQVECTVNGIGERAGNAALEEIVMAMRTRGDVLDFETGIDVGEIMRASRMVSNMTGIVVQPNKAVVGQNAFAHESGIHQDGVLKERTTYEIMDPTEIGAGESKLVLGPRSGRHAIVHRLGELGYKVQDADMPKIYERFLEIAEAKKEVFDEDLAAIMEEHDARPSVEGYELVGLQTLAGSHAIPTATIELKMPTGEVVCESAAGKGPVEAAYSAVDRITGLECKLTDYSLKAVREARTAVGQARVKIECQGHTAVGVGASTDVIEASVRAYVHAVNRVVTLINGNGAK